MRVTMGLVMLAMVAACGDEGVDPAAEVEVTAEVEVRVEVEVGAETEVAAETEVTETEVTETEVSAEATIGWCNLQFPTALILAPGQTSETLYGRVFVAGVTDASSPGADYPIVVELGVGSGDVSTWNWTTATFARDVGNDDEFEATFVAGSSGDYRFAFRARNAAGDWSYCDATGLDDGFAVADSGTVTVVIPPVVLPEYCRIQFPTALILAPGQTSETLYGRVFVAGVTDAGSPGGDYPIVVELGVGSGDVSTWNWTTATFARDVGNDDEFEATFVAGSSGDYRFAFRARNAAGDWSYCDATGLDDGFALADSGTLTVVIPPVVLPEYCRIQFPTEAITLVSGAATEVYGVVYVPDVTGENGGGTPAVISAVGYGPSGSTPDDTWTWSTGTFNVHVDNGFGQLTNDEHRATITGGAPGSYAWAWRFAFDGADPRWRYCDRAGSTTFDPAQAGALVVTAE